MTHQFIDQATPLALSLFLSVIGIAAELITQARDITAETDEARRREKARSLIISSLAPNICLGAFSFDIWVITTLFSSEDKALKLYNLYGKGGTVQLLLVAHLFIYLLVLAWGGVVRGNTGGDRRFAFEVTLGITALVLCIVFQSY
jgi:hypothetical protein